MFFKSTVNGSNVIGYKYRVTCMCTVGSLATPRTAYYCCCYYYYYYYYLPPPQMPPLSVVSKVYVVASTMIFCVRVYVTERLHIMCGLV
jgi:hypothetical protein